MDSGPAPSGASRNDGVFLTRRRFIAAASATTLLPFPAFAQPGVQPPPKQPPPEDLSVPEPTRIDVKARPIPAFESRDAERTRFGALEYRSGLVLTSGFRGFGGLSALRLDPAGERFTALSDKGTWFTGRITSSAGKMTGLAEVEAAPILGPDGRPITTRKWFDTESLAFDGGGTAYVGIERVNQVLRFDFGRSGVRAHGQPVTLPPAAKKLPFNGGLEALVFVPKGAGRPLAGTLIAISERGLDAQRNGIAFLISGKSADQFGIHRSGGFDVSDAVLLPSGDLLLLERKFSWLTGIQVRLRRIALTDIAPNAVVDGPVIFEADLGQEIDNLEGIDAHLDASGATVLTMISDDNFSLIQRTLLLQFTLVE